MICVELTCPHCHGKHVHYIDLDNDPRSGVIDNLHKILGKKRIEIAELKDQLMKAHLDLAGVIETMKHELDNCDHPDCEAERKRSGYSSCAGGHLAKRVVHAIIDYATKTR